jgi:hypothetical protein
MDEGVGGSDNRAPSPCFDEHDLSKSILEAKNTGKIRVASAWTYITSQVF